MLFRSQTQPAQVPLCSVQRKRNVPRGTFSPCLGTDSPWMTVLPEELGMKPTWDGRHAHEEQEPRGRFVDDPSSNSDT